jgi:hypothetical protein
MIVSVFMANPPDANLVRDTGRVRVNPGSEGRQGRCRIVRLMAGESELFCEKSLVPKDPEDDCGASGDDRQNEHHHAKDEP